MEDELKMRRAEVEALRTYYTRTHTALNELENTLRIVKAKPFLSEREQKALSELLEAHQ